MNISIFSALLVFIGGGLGAVCRFVMSRTLPNEVFPYATFTTNILACVLLGFLVQALLWLTVPLRQNVSFLLVTGFCGGFSTFSTLNWELFRLLEQGQYQTALVYSIGNVCLGLAAIAFGFWLGQLAN